LLRKEIYLSFLLSILLLLSIDISFYNHVILGKQDSKDDDNERSDDNGDSKDDDNERSDDNGDSKDDDNERSGDEAEDFDDISINELFGDNNDNNIKEENEEKNDSPFILPFKAVPFP
jgi:hypothetical protein